MAAASEEITVSITVFREMLDADGNPGTAAKMSKRGDRLMAHATDSRNFYHQEIKNLKYAVPASAVEPYLPIGQVWWFHDPSEATFINPVSRILAGDPLLANASFEAMLGALGGGGYEAELSGFKIDKVVSHEPSNPAGYNSMTTKLKSDLQLFCPHITSFANPAASSLEEWLKSDAEWLAEQGVALEGGDGEVDDRKRLSNACCYDIIIDTMGKAFSRLKEGPPSERRHVDVVIDRLKRRASYKWLYAFFHGSEKEFDPSDMGLTLDLFRKFFEAFKLNLVVMDVAGRVNREASYFPEKTDENGLTPVTIFVLQHNKHLFLINQNLNMLYQARTNANSLINQPLRTENPDLDPEQEARPPSSGFPLTKERLPDFFVEKMDDLVKLNFKVVKSVSKGGKETYYERVRVAIPGNLWLILSELVMRCRYEPKVRMDGGSIATLELKIDGVLVVISNPDNPKNKGIPFIPTEAIFMAYRKCDQMLADLLRNKRTLSTWSPSVLMALKALDCSPMIFGLKTDAAATTAFDINKAYTSFLREIKVIPVFTVFDDLRPFRYTPFVPPSPVVNKPTLSERDLKRAIRTWTGPLDAIRLRLVSDFGCDAAFAETLLATEVDRNSFYLVQVTSLIEPSDPRFLLLDQEFCLMAYDNWLIVRDWPMVVTLGVLRPSTLVPVSLDIAIAKIWQVPNETLPVPLKKFLVNKAVGFCGKQKNQKNTTFLFTDIDEATKYQHLLSGTLIADLLPDGRRLYFVSDKREAILRDGFYFTQFIVYNKQRKALYDIANLPANVGKPVLAVKTDCIWFPGFTEGSEVPKDDSFEGIGRYEVKKDLPYKIGDPVIKVFQVVNEPAASGITALKTRLIYLDKGASPRELQVKDEFNSHEFLNLFSKNNHVLVRADIPGAGKSYALKKFCEKVGVEECLLSTPYNALCYEFRSEGLQSITLDKLLGLNFKSDDERKKFDISAISVIVFDEVFCYDRSKLAKLKRFVESNKTLPDGSERRFFAAGDPNQNAPIDSTFAFRGQEAKDYYTGAIHRIFPLLVTLHKCKRLKKPEQQATLMEIKRLVFETETPLIEIARQFFTPIKTVEEARGMGVCFKNETVRVVNEARQAMAISRRKNVRFEGGRSFYQGQRLRCDTFLEQGGGRPSPLFTNFVYKVKYVRKSDLVLTDAGGVEFVVPFFLEKKHLAYDHANTCHSLQGLTASEGITLFDLFEWGLTREWFHTALTRANDLDKILFYDGPRLSEAVDADELKQVIREKIAGHKREDQSKKRLFFEEDFITVEDVMALLEASLRCYICNEEVQLAWSDAADPAQFSLDRINNDEAHVKGNIQLCCWGCNRRKSDS